MQKNLPSDFKSVKNYSGFTFIELLMAIVIMALIFGVGFSNYRGFQKRQHLTGAARAFKTDLRFAQEQALSGTKPAGCSVLDSYRLRWVDSTHYDISAICDAGSNIITIKTVDLSLIGMQFGSPFTAVMFKVLGRGTNLTLNLTITLSDGGSPANTIQVIVTPGGGIN